MLFFLMFACKERVQKRKDYTGEIDSLLMELREMDDSLATLRIPKVQYINDSLSNVYDTAEVMDTLGKRYQRYNQSRDVLNWYDNVNREINFSRSHLNALKRKFKENDLPDSTKKKELKQLTVLSQLPVMMKKTC